MKPRLDVGVADSKQEKVVVNFLQLPIDFRSKKNLRKHFMTPFTDRANLYQYCKALLSRQVEFEALRAQVSLVLFLSTSEGWKTELEFWKRILNKPNNQTSTL